MKKINNKLYIIILINLISVIIPFATLKYISVSATSDLVGLYSIFITLTALGNLYIGNAVELDIFSIYKKATHIEFNKTTKELHTSIIIISLIFAVASHIYLEITAKKDIAVWAISGVIYISVVLQSIMTLNGAILKMEGYVIVTPMLTNFLRQAIFLTMCFMLLQKIGVFTETTIYYLFILYGVSSAILIFVMVNAIRRRKTTKELMHYVGFRMASYSKLREISLKGAPLFMAYLNIQLDIFIVGFVIGYGSTAVYKLGSMMAMVILMPLTALVGIYGPKIVDIVENSPNPNEMAYRKHHKLAFAIGCGIYLLIAFISNAAVPWFFSSEYNDATWIFMILGIGQIFSIVMGVNVGSLVILGMQRCAIIISLTSLIFNLCLSITLAKYFGLMGVAIGSLMANILLNIWSSRVLFREKRFNVSMLKV